MKFVFVFAALVCTNLYLCQAKNTTGSPVGDKKMCASPGTAININVHGNEDLKGERGEKGDTGAKGENGTHCKCSLQDPNKPSAHIEAVNITHMTYQTNTVIKDWSVSAPHSHLAGGMTYHDGKLTVPTPGRYYIYAQLYYNKNGRVYVRVNNNVITMLHTPGAAAGTLNTGGVFNLKAGDVITLTTGTSIKIYMWSRHSYFGAFLI